MLAIQAGRQIFKDAAVGIVQMHADLLIDDADLLLNALLCEIGSGDELQQQFQRAFKVFGAGNIVGGHIIAGEGIGARTQRSQFRRHIPITGKIEHFMLQKMGDAVTDADFSAFQFELRMDGAEIRYKISKFLRKAGTGIHHNRQTVGQLPSVQFFTQSGIFSDHDCTPFRK